MYQLEKRKIRSAICKAKLILTVIFRFTEVNARHASEILINDPGIIQNKLPPIDKEYSVRLSGNTVPFLHEDFVRSHF